MRNHLYPSKLALYVLHGRTLQLDGTLRERPQPREVLPEVPAAPRPASSASQILEHLEKLEPLHFERRMLGQTANAGRLHGSVIVNNILHELQKRGVPITTLDGDWQSTSVEGAIEQGRVKRPGQYICEHCVTAQRAQVAQG